VSETDDENNETLGEFFFCFPPVFMVTSLSRTKNYRVYNRVELPTQRRSSLEERIMDGPPRRLFSFNVDLVLVEGYVSFDRLCLFLTGKKGDVKKNHTFQSYVSCFCLFFFFRGLYSLIRTVMVLE
jgi:hypothetical protein